MLCPRRKLEKSAPLMNKATVSRRRRLQHINTLTVCRGQLSSVSRECIGSKLYCFVTGTCVCEQLAQGCYLKAEPLTVTQL